MAKKPTKKTTRRRETTQRRTTTGRNGGQTYVRGNSRDERVGVANPSGRTNVPLGSIGRSAARRLGSMEAQAFMDASTNRRAPTTSPRPKRRPSRKTKR